LVFVIEEAHGVSGILIDGGFHDERRSHRLIKKRLPDT
jgi:hypothetical protein